jgi:small subunit ribosomal protein S19
MARSAKKGPYVDLRLIDKINKAKAAKNSKDIIKTWSRSSMVIPSFVGMVINVHDGKKFVAVHITESMVGHKLGEFAPTRIFRMHSGQRKVATSTSTSKE